MKIKKSEVIINKYEYENGFIVEIDKNDGIYECYLYHKDYGIKSFIFGLPEFQKCENKHYTLEEIEDIVAENIEECIYNYEYDYMD